MRESKQDYLKALVSLEAQSKEGTVRITKIAKRLEVSPAAVSDMAKKLEKEKLIKILPYKGLALTEKGRKTGVNMIRHHRIWETFLSQKLDMSWEEVHEEAERLEHSCTNRLIDKLDAFLGYPTTDPHGSPIPRADGTFPESGTST